MVLVSEVGSHSSSSCSLSARRGINNRSATNTHFSTIRLLEIFMVVMFVSLVLGQYNIIKSSVRTTTNSNNRPPYTTTNRRHIIVNEATIKEIQRECLRVYPKQLIANLTKDNIESVPNLVDKNPNRQAIFLSSELTTDKGIFYPTLLDEILPVMRSYVSEGTKFLDLGSGDGRILFLAAALGANVTGKFGLIDLMETILIVCYMHALYPIMHSLFYNLYYYYHYRGGV